MYPKELQEQAVSGEESSAPASLQILAESVFIRRSWQCSPAPFMRTAECERKVRRLINGCGCGSVDYVVAGAQI